MLGLMANLFIIIHTLIHCKSLKRASSTVLLFGYAVTNVFLVTPVYLISIVAVVTSSFGKEILEEGKALCMIQGYVSIAALEVKHGMLALISIDRFLNITKPLVHKQYFKPKHVAIVMATMWLAVALAATAPFYTTGFLLQETGFICIATSGAYFIVVSLLTALP